jgi:UDP-galactopyranose mutase
VEALTVQLNAEIGRSNRPFTPVAPRHYNTMNGRLQYRTRNFQALATADTDYENNSVLVSTFASHSRTYAANGSWTPRPRVFP